MQMIKAKAIGPTSGYSHFEV